MRHETAAFYARFGYRVKVLRERAGLTQEQLAAALEPPVTRVFVTLLERGRHRVFADRLPGLAKALGVATIHELVSGEAVASLSEPGRWDRT